MSPTRKLLVVAAGLAGVLLLAVLFACTSQVQTWIVHRVLAERPEWGIEIGQAALDLRHVRLTQVTANYHGARLVLPDFKAELPVVTAAWDHRVAISRLEAQGWTLDLTHYQPVPAGAGAAPEPKASLPVAPVAGAALAAPVKAVFQGVFAQLQLPVDLELDGVTLDGEVILPAAPGEPPLRVRLNLAGGGLGAGREGDFNLTTRIDVARAGVPVNALDTHGTLVVVMDTPRTFAKIAAKVDCLASGPAFPQGVQLTASLSASRGAGGESYVATIESVGKRLVDLEANYPANAARLGGVWRLDVRDTDVAPFLLGRPVPGFEAVGAGMFEAANDFSEIHTAGRIQSSASRLEVFRPELAEIGPVTVFSEFDLTQRESTTRVDKLILTVRRPDPVLSVQALQPFEFKPSTGELKVADPAANLVAIDLQSVPLAWIQPLLKGLAVSGGSLRGNLTAGARDGGLLLRTRSPLVIDQLTIARAGHKLAQQLAVSADLSADYTPAGWQAEITGLNLDSGGQNLATLALKAGQLAGAGQPLKATGRLTLVLPALRQQPLAEKLPALTGGRARLDFSTSLGALRELQADLRVTELAGPGGAALPSVASDMKVSLDRTGLVTFNAPVKLTNEARQRVTDLVIGGTLKPDAGGLHVAARIGGSQIFVEDLQQFAVLAGAPAGNRPTASASLRDEQPFWHGLDGEISVVLMKVVGSGPLAMSDLSGQLRLEPTGLMVDHWQAGLGDGSGLKLEGSVRFRSTEARPYVFGAQLDITNFDSAPLFKAINPNQPPQVEGRFNLTSKLNAQARNVGELLAGATGDLTLTSKGGTFRLLTANVASKVDSVGRVAAIGAFIGNVASALGKGSPGGFASSAQAVADLAKLLSAIQYDQLNVVVKRGDDLNTALSNFSLLAPELRLEGSGGLTGKPGVGFLQQPLAMKFQLKARGHSADVLRYLHVLEDQTDDLGYATCTLPLNVGGTLAAPDTKELQSALAKLAIERSGAGDLLNRWLGK
ncbi:MAG: hypothetical protein ACHQ4G_03835 [Opitutales bacterium]